MFSLIRLGSIALVLLVGTAACTYSPRYDSPRAWDHEYYYYPHVGVYFHLFSGDYFYRDGVKWVRVKILPKHYLLDHRIRRTLVIKDKKPYRYHADHRKHYPMPPEFKRDRRHDSVEREHNHRRHKEYRRRLADPSPR